MKTLAKNKIKLPAAEVNEEQAQILAKAFWKIAGHYDLSRKEQACLLGMKNTARIQNLEKRSEIPIEPDKFARIGNLLAIHKNLRMLFPENREIVYSWLKTECSDFNGLSPLDWIMDDEINSFSRLFTVRRYLDQKRVG